jgi:hypothetical protein
MGAAVSTLGAVVSTCMVDRIRIRSGEAETTAFLLWVARRHGHSPIHLG